MPTDERIRFDVPQNIAPLEHSAQSCHQPPRGIVGPPWFDLPLLKQRQLLPEEEILGCKRTARPDSDSEKATEIEQYDRYSNKAVRRAGGIERMPNWTDVQESAPTSSLNSYRWRRHCRGLYQTPIVA